MQFLDALTEFERAVQDEDISAMEEAHAGLSSAYGDATRDELAQGGPRLADLLDDVPLGGRSNIAVLIGACVEQGADAVACGFAVVRNVAENLSNAKIFAETWRETLAEALGDELPDPDGEVIRELFEVFGPEITLSWWELDNWMRAGVAVLQHPQVRGALNQEQRDYLIEQLDALHETADRWDKCLAYLLVVLDDEPLVVLHRESATGYRVRTTGIGDNFQLDTLLGNALIGAGHIPGDPPSAEAVAACLDTEGMVPSEGIFLFHALDGSRVWYEGNPSDIPVVDGHRVLVLDPRPFPHHFPAGRFSPRMPASLDVEDVLSEQEVAAWFERAKPLEAAVE
ncbi:hypothetical protein DFR68_111128 [Nocardia mexicana]|uniref:Uncharacterized protein n=2 Tax=Nocardia mexicana TaxID=279262 RepID=A0A370GSF5_9NOCA|nr:hypothetical protein DFR68_111128 [Nocardia mexicana]